VGKAGGADRAGGGEELERDHAPLSVCLFGVGVSSTPVQPGEAQEDGEDKGADEPSNEQGFPMAMKPCLRFLGLVRRVCRRRGCCCRLVGR
jgi:hypothetical protein